MPKINRSTGELLKHRQTAKEISAILKKSKIHIFEYYAEDDRLVVYEDITEAGYEIPGYLHYLETNTRVHPEDRWKAIEFYHGRLEGSVELRTIEKDGTVILNAVEASWFWDDETGQRILFGSSRDISVDKQREEFLKKQAERDSLTGLYNRFYGKELMSDYLMNKNPYATCGLMILDIDYFKNVNDTYGHLIGDKVLEAVAEFLTALFSSKDVVMRSGGDEYVALLKDISHTVLVKKMGQVVEGIRKLQVIENYVLTCSVGVCFLPENVSGYTYNQMFENADWALYQAKENGKNGYVFCDNLQRFQQMGNGAESGNAEIEHSEIEARYLHNDIVSTAFEVFEKMNSFDVAVRLLMKVVGIRFRLDRITVIQTNVKEKNTKRIYQWLAPGIESIDEEPGSFTKEDFLTLFHSYDEYGTTVLQYDNMSMYSEGAAKLLVQGRAKTVVYAAMYCEGQYTGAISYVVCSEKRYWTRENRSQLGELTKIISAHLAKNKALNVSHRGVTTIPEYDALTGLLSFSGFREEVERMIVGGNAASHMLIYSDFENFKYFNQKLGYSVGDQLLKDFCQFVIDLLKSESDVYFTRVIADQFILFAPCQDIEVVKECTDRSNKVFAARYAAQFPEMQLKIRSGIYPIPKDCTGASAAIDAANYARKQIDGRKSDTVRLYDREMEKRQQLEAHLIYGMDEAMENGQFEVWFQPRFSLEQREIVGAEALIRWKREDGEILFPDVFVPVYERNGRIVELDFYMFERVVAFQAKLLREGKRVVPVSVNASILHAMDKRTAEKYRRILEKYGVSPGLLEIELTETATVSDYENVRDLFQCLHDAGIRTALDDFGAGYSVLNTVADLPIDTIKIDREFIGSCAKNKRGIRFLNQIVKFISGLGYHAVCEGIETEEEAEMLRKAGCKEAQGYWFARPMTMENFEKMTEEHTGNRYCLDGSEYP